MPPTIVGAVVSHRAGAYSFTGMVFDPNDRTNDYWVDGLFEDGVNVSFAPGWSGKVGERDTSVSLTATFSTANGTNLAEILLPPGLKTGEKDGSFNITLQAGHLIKPSAVLKGKGLGVYAKAAIADGNPNPIRSSVIGGLAGHGMIAYAPVRQLRRRLLLLRLQQCARGRAGSRRKLRERAGPRAVLQPRDRQVVPRRRRPPGGRSCGGQPDRCGRQCARECRVLRYRCTPRPPSSTHFVSRLVHTGGASCWPRPA